MTPAQIRTRVETTSARLVTMQADLETKAQLYRTSGDGGANENDLQTLSLVRNRATEVQNRIDQLLQQLVRSESDGNAKAEQKTRLMSELKNMKDELAGLMAELE